MLFAFVENFAHIVDGELATHAHSALWTVVGGVGPFHPFGFSARVNSVFAVKFL